MEYTYFSLRINDTVPNEMIEDAVKMGIHRYFPEKRIIASVNRIGGIRILYVNNNYHILYNGYITFTRVTEKRISYKIESLDYLKFHKKYKKGLKCFDLTAI